MPKLPQNFQFLPTDEAKPGQRPSALPSAVTPLPRFARMLQQLWQQLAFLFNGNISFGDGTNADNISGAWATVADTGAANTDFTITHNLGRIPVGYILMTSAQGTEIYTGSVAATTTQITLRSTQAHDAITLFIV